MKPPDFAFRVRDFLLDRFDTQIFLSQFFDVHQLASIFAVSIPIHISNSSYQVELRTGPSQPFVNGLAPQGSAFPHAYLPIAIAFQLWGRRVAIEQFGRAEWELALEYDEIWAEPAVQPQPREFPPVQSGGGSIPKSVYEQTSPHDN